MGWTRRNARTERDTWALVGRRDTVCTRPVGSAVCAEHATSAIVAFSFSTIPGLRPVLAGSGWRLRRKSNVRCTRFCEIVIKSEMSKECRCKQC